MIPGAIIDLRGIVISSEMILKGLNWPRSASFCELLGDMRWLSPAKTLS
jgi:hypothetical protein